MKKKQKIVQQGFVIVDVSAKPPHAVCPVIDVFGEAREVSGYGELFYNKKLVLQLKKDLGWKSLKVVPATLTFEVLI